MAQVAPVITYAHDRPNTCGRREVLCEAFTAPVSVPTVSAVVRSRLPLSLALPVLPVLFWEGVLRSKWPQVRCGEAGQAAFFSASEAGNG